MVWQYIGQVVFNMLILTGTIKLSDRIVKEMMGLKKKKKKACLWYDTSCRENKLPYDSVFMRVSAGYENG